MSRVLRRLKALRTCHHLISQQCIYPITKASWLGTFGCVENCGTFAGRQWASCVLLQDIFTLFHLNRPFKFVSKKSNFLIPIIGWSMFLTGQ